MAADHACSGIGDEVANVFEISTNNVAPVSGGRGRPRGRDRGRSMCARILAVPTCQTKAKGSPHCDVSFYRHVIILRS